MMIKLKNAKASLEKEKKKEITSNLRKPDPWNGLNLPFLRISLNISLIINKLIFQEEIQLLQYESVSYIVFDKESECSKFPLPLKKNLWSQSSKRF